jgi:subtilase family serine protease
MRHAHPQDQASFLRKTKRLALALAALGSVAAQAAPYPTPRTPAAQDLGTLDAAHSTATITVTVALRLRNADQVESLVSALYTPGSPSFHQFLTPDQFRARFAPDQATIDRATAYFTKAGLQVSRATSTLLQLTGTPSAIQNAFQVQLHLYEIPAHDRSPAYRYRAALTAPQIASSAVADSVHAVLGLDNRPRYYPHLRQSPLAGKLHASRAPSASAPATPNPPGFWTVDDLAQYYDIQPLYAKGIHGEGKTIGIVTLAAFTPSDVFTYWNALGLKTDPKRIRVVNVDGGPGVPSDDSGSIETTLDVEQSGGIAPAAKIVVYQAPNTDQGFIDVFARAIDDNTADTLSVSWGEWEWMETQVSVESPITGRSTDALHAMSSLFLQAALQGQSMFAAAGDQGAYDANDPQQPYPLPNFSKVLSVDAPASSPWITAAGGTTLPGDQIYQLPDGSLYTISIPKERAWGWEYLTELCAKLGYDPISCGILPAGGGGGVSAFFPLPFYQYLTPGIRTTEANQVLVDYTGAQPVTILKLPAHYAGRNLPDVSLNADPETGYTVLYTSDKDGFGEYDYYGGTSFVAPQLNAITALVGQSVHGRLGLINPALYVLVDLGLAYRGSNAPLNDITQGTNEFYVAHTGYDQGTGVGTMDVANFARVLQTLFH